MAEESAVLKLSGKIYDKFVGPAMCFDDEDDAFEAIVEGRVAKGTVMVIRYEGPKGAPGMPEMLSPGAALVGAGLGKGERLDDKFSRRFIAVVIVQHEKPCRRGPGDGRKVQRRESRHHDRPRLSRSGGRRGDRAGRGRRRGDDRRSE